MKNKDKMQEHIDYAEMYGALTLLNAIIKGLKKDAAILPGGEILLKEFNKLYGKMQRDLMADMGDILNKLKQKLEEEGDGEWQE